MSRVEQLADGRVTLHCGDCLAVLETLAENSIDSVVCDPPYHLTSIVKRFGAENAAPAKAGKTGAYARASAGFMGKQWDGGDIAFQIDTWRRVLRVLKPGGHLIAFGGTRTFGRMHCAIEDAGFEIRDMISWIYGSGFPKSHDVSKGIDRAAGVERKPTGRIKPGHEGFANRGNMSSVQSFKGTMGGEGGFSRPWMNDPEKVEAYHQETAPGTDAAREWDGWGTALKPACEPIVLARKPLSEGTVAANVLRWGTGAINVDGTRIGLVGGTPKLASDDKSSTVSVGGYLNSQAGELNGKGRWPANVIHDGSEEVVGAFPESKSGELKPEHQIKGGFAHPDCYHSGPTKGGTGYWGSSEGSAARFFYTAKADDRLGSKHPTVKPVDLMQYLVRLVTPPKGVVLDPFAGTGTTGEACIREGMSAVLIEREEEYQGDIRRRMKLALSGPDERAREAIKAKTKDKPIDAGPLFGGTAEIVRGGGRQIYGHFADQDERLARQGSSGE